MIDMAQVEGWRAWERCFLFCSSRAWFWPPIGAPVLVDLGLCGAWIAFLARTIGVFLGKSGVRDVEELLRFNF